MPRVLSDKTLELLADMPPYYADDPMTQAVINAQANELQRIEDSGFAILNAMFPVTANDVPLLNGAAVARICSMWETLLGLPVNPPGIALADRRDKITAHIRKRQSGRGLDWVDTISEAVGGASWSHQEGPGSYQVTVRIPYVAGGYLAGTLQTLLAVITPAHLVITVQYTTGFVVGINQVGVDPL